MARTARTDRSTVADAPLTVRFTRGERDALNKAVEIREKELGIGATVSQGSLIRGLVRRYCEEMGIAVEEDDAVSVPATPTPAARPASKRSGAKSRGTRA